MGMTSPACPSCGAAVEQRTGAGRPAVYCGEACRRLAEYEIRALVRRIDRAELELRELGNGGHHARSGHRGFLSPEERAARTRALHGWLAEDRARLRSLLGSGGEA